MVSTIRASKTDHFRSGSGSRSEVFPTPPRGSDPNRPKVLKITVPYHMELGVVFKMAPSPPYSDTARVPGGLPLLAPLRSGGHFNY